MRMSIFEIKENNWTMSREVDKIVHMFEEEPVAALIKEDGEYDCSYLITYEVYIDTACMATWKARGTATSFSDFLSSINYTAIKERARHDLNSFLQLIELVYNCYMLVEKNDESSEWIAVFNNLLLKEIMDYDLKKVNYCAIYNKETETVAIKEIADNPSSETDKTIVAAPKSVKEEIFEYRNPLVKGNLKRKREILLDMGNELEPKIKGLEKKYKSLEDNISFLLNNMNIRHNNKELGKFYNEVCASLSDSEQEKVYDNLYHLMNLAFMVLENEDRMNETETLKKKCKKKSNTEDA